MPAGVAFYQLPGEGDHSKRNVETVSLFDLKRTNGWWPAVGTDDGQQILPVSHSICNVYLHTSLGLIAGSHLSLNNLSDM